MIKKNQTFVPKLQNLTIQQVFTDFVAVYLAFFTKPLNEMATDNSNWNLKERTFLVIKQKDELTCGSATVSNSFGSEGDT